MHCVQNINYKYFITDIQNKYKIILLLPALDIKMLKTFVQCNTYRNIGAGTIFRLGQQKLNDFSVGEAKIVEEQSRQSNSK